MKFIRMLLYGLHDPMLHIAGSQASHLSHEERRFSEGLSSAPATICHIAVILFPAYHGGGVIVKFLPKVGKS